MQVKCFKDKNKINLFVLFKYYIDEFEYKNNKRIRIRINNNNKYIREILKIYRKKREIRTKLIIVDSFEINNYVEYLN